MTCNNVLKAKFLRSSASARSPRRDAAMAEAARRARTAVDAVRALAGMASQQAPPKAGKSLPAEELNTATPTKSASSGQMDKSPILPIAEQVATAANLAGERAYKGDVGEAIAAAFVHHVLDHNVLFDMATRSKSQGLDLVTIKDVAESGTKICVIEVKSTTDPKQSKPALTASTKQMSNEWVLKRLNEGEMLGPVEEADIGPDAVIEKLVVHVNYATNVLSLWDVGVDGRVGEASTTIALDDLAQFADVVGGAPRGSSSR